MSKGKAKAVLCRLKDGQYDSMVEVSFQLDDVFPIIFWQKHYFIPSGSVDEEGRYVYRIGTVGETIIHPEAADVSPINQTC